MVPLERLALENEQDDDGEDRERDHFLDDFELHQGERAAVAVEADAVGRYGEAVFKESDAPRKKDHADQRPAGGNLHLLELQVPVPGECHEDVGTDQHQDGPKCLHSLFSFSGRKDNKEMTRLAQKLVKFRFVFKNPYLLH